MTDFPFLQSGNALVRQAGTYYNTAPDANVRFVGAPSLEGNVAVVGSVGGIWNDSVAVGSKWEVFDFSQTVHQQHHVLVYGSTVRSSWIDGADAAVGGRFADVFIARAQAGNSLDFRGGGSADKIVLTDVRGPMKVYAEMGHDGSADVAYVAGNLGTADGSAQVIHWSRPNGSDTTLIRVNGSEIHLDGAEVIYFNNGYLLDNQLNMNTNAGQATAMLTTISGGQLHANGGGLNWVTDLLDDLPRIEVSRMVLEATGFGRDMSNAQFAEALLIGTGHDSSAGNVAAWTQAINTVGRVVAFDTITAYDSTEAYNSSLLSGDGGITVVGMNLDNSAILSVNLLN